MINHNYNWILLLNEKLIELERNLKNYLATENEYGAMINSNSRKEILLPLI